MQVMEQAGGAERGFGVGVGVGAEHA